MGPVDCEQRFHVLVLSQKYLFLLHFDMYYCGGELKENHS